MMFLIPFAYLLKLIDGSNTTSLSLKSTLMSNIGGSECNLLNEILI